MIPIQDGPDPTLREEDVAYIGKRFREIAEYLDEKGCPGTVWRIMTTKGTIYSFVCSASMRGNDKTTNTYGMCHYGPKTITLSKFRVLANTLERTKEVILHEIAHALCPQGAGHGPIWKQRMVSMGLKPERCFSDHDPSMHRTNRPFKGECPSCHKIIFSRSRRKKSCGTCHPYKYNPRYQFIWSINNG